MMDVIFKLNRTQIYADKRRYNFSGIFLFFNIQKICVHLCPKGISIIINLEEKRNWGVFDGPKLATPQSHIHPLSALLTCSA